MTILVLNLSIVDCSIEKRGCKQGIVLSGDSYYIKLVFVLLIKVIAVYIEFSII